MNNVPQEIIEYLLNTYNDVESIILHGSRAAGFAREHSDWDFIILTNTQQRQDTYRHEINNHHFEFKLEVLPIGNVEIFERFDTKLQFSKVVYDKNTAGKDLIKSAKKFYTAGIPEKFFDDNYKQCRKQNRLHVVRELQDALDEPAIFMKKIGKLYPQIINEWYWYKKKDYPKNLYISLPQIEKEDTWFFETLKIVYEGKYSRKEKVIALEKLINEIYK